MQEVTIYSTGCPRCRSLIRMLEMDEIPYREIKDLDTIIAFGKQHGISEIPILETPDGVFGFSKAIAWVKQQ